MFLDTILRSSPFIDIGRRFISFKLYIPGFTALKTVREANGSVVVVRAEGGPRLFEASVAMCPTTAFPTVVDEMTAGALVVVWLTLAVERPATLGPVLVVA